MNTLPTLFCHIDQHSIVLVRGPDAVKFLQGQVTCDIKALTLTPLGNIQQTISTLGAHCTHKGRIVFSFRAVALDNDTVALCIPTNIIDIALAALQKYIVFSKAELIDAQADYMLVGIIGKSSGEDSAQHLINALGISGDEIPTQTNQVVVLANGNGVIICLSEQRYELWLTPSIGQAVIAQSAQETLFDNNTWDWLNISNGIAEIQSQTSESLTPHAINFHNINNTISFQKGCYTGQEVVARMQYLGKLKRQLFLFELPTEYEPFAKEIALKQSLYNAKQQSIGDIVCYATHEGKTRLLANVKVDEVEKNEVYIDDAHQHKLVLLPITNH